ncbi:hypothetical protein SUDANB96_00265 [Streptomyces sp. enrichment culture]
MSFAWPDDTLPSTTCPSPSRPAAPAWSHPTAPGKSTLLKLIAGRLRPATGTVSVGGTLGYLPQTLPLTGDLTVAEVLGVADVIRALDAVESGDVSEEHFTTIGDDWDIEDRTRAQLDRLGLGGLALDRSLSTLSGGQVVSLGLAAQLLRRPDVLLLDEPTNNLDLVGCGPVGGRAPLLPGRVPGGQPRRAVPRRDRGEPPAAAGRRQA